MGRRGWGPRYYTQFFPTYEVPTQISLHKTKVAGFVGKRNVPFLLCRNFMFFFVLFYKSRILSRAVKEIQCSPVHQILLEKFNKIEKQIFIIYYKNSIVCKIDS